MEATRATLQDSSDPRVERTRRAIVDGAHRLLDDGATTFSVADLVRTSGVSRSTFYAHFEDLDAVAVLLLRESFTRIRSLYAEARRRGTGDAVGAMRVAQVRVVELFVANRALFAALAASSTANGFRRELVHAVSVEIETTLTAFDVVPAGVRADLTAVYVASAAVGLLETWLRGDLRATDDEVVEHLMVLMPTWLARGGRP